MSPSSPTLLLVRDELVGFAKSKVMLVLWVVLPLLASAGYLLLPDRLFEAQGMSRSTLTATSFMGLVMSSIAGTVAALMVAVDLISERNRKVYALFLVRPIRPEAIVWAKFIAVFACVTVACLVSHALGIALDAVRGSPPSAAMLADVLKSLVSLTAVLALSSAVGVLAGTLVRSILVAVILVLYVGQNLAIVPMLPMYLGLLPNHFWLMMLVSAVLAIALVYLAGVLFRRSEQ